MCLLIVQEGDETEDYILVALAMKARFWKTFAHVYNDNNEQDNYGKCQDATFC